MADKHKSDKVETPDGEQAPEETQAVENPAMTLPNEDNYIDIQDFAKRSDDENLQTRCAQWEELLQSMPSHHDKKFYVEQLNNTIQGQLKNITDEQAIQIAKTALDDAVATLQSLQR